MREPGQPVAFKRPLFPERQRQFIKLAVECRRRREPKGSAVQERNAGDLRKIKPIDQTPGDSPCSSLRLSEQRDLAAKVLQEIFREEFQRKRIDRLRIFKKADRQVRTGLVNGCRQVFDRDEVFDGSAIKKHDGRIRPKVSHDPFCRNTHKHELTLNFVFVRLKTKTVDDLNFKVFLAEGARKMRRDVRHEGYACVRVQIMCDDMRDDNSGDFSIAHLGPLSYWSAS